MIICCASDEPPQLKGMFPCTAWSDFPERLHEVAVTHIPERPGQSDMERSLAFLSRDTPPRATEFGWREESYVVEHAEPGDLWVRQFGEQLGTGFIEEAVGLFITHDVERPKVFDVEVLNLFVNAVVGEIDAKMLKERCEQATASVLLFRTMHKTLPPFADHGHEVETGVCLDLLNGNARPRSSDFILNTSVQGFQLPVGDLGGQILCEQEISLDLSRDKEQYSPSAMKENEQLAGAIPMACSVSNTSSSIPRSARVSAWQKRVGNMSTRRRAL
ncbi:hypothetical protein F2Q69_00043902 [Brassica cretica]|uniref:Uncharacterized protein n=1 Tax=Brassica cretica TaxID=69181 RepID=A0A8S9NHA0_BRACR|nr:hypothetical protein F2Q69_00043902 [Brassica cretica]